MLNRIVLLAAIAIGLAAAPNGANAAQFSPARSVFAAGHAPANLGRPGGLGYLGRLGHPGRPGGLGPRSFRFGAASADGAKCGVWVCTWRTGNGGCLVWEKTACKIKTIDPFN
jgi:hypothetical protein